MEVKFSLIGVDELIAAIGQVNDDLKLKGGRFALRKAANLVATSLKSGAQALDDAETGRSIASNVAVRFSSKTFKSTRNLMFRVGIKHGAVLSKGGDKSANAPTPHWRLLEFGTEKMAAHPFARPALERNVGAATAEFVKQYKVKLDRLVKQVKKASLNVSPTV